ncbi:MAG: hypothetical protein Q4B60_03180 [Erysipelotrichaceae bacterium]|nr:hypothetical protein [Erysipelotrichaceae bacterium]
MKKRFVDVICLNDQYGNVKPLFLIWDNNRRVPILKVKDICPGASLTVGGTGLRYTCLFKNDQIKHLYYDRGKWYVEML